MYRVSRFQPVRNAKKISWMQQCCWMEKRNSQVYTSDLQRMINGWILVIIIINWFIYRRRDKKKFLTNDGHVRRNHPRREEAGLSIKVDDFSQWESKNGKFCKEENFCHWNCISAKMMTGQIEDSKHILEVNQLAILWAWWQNEAMFNIRNCEYIWTGKGKTVAIISWFKFLPETASFIKNRNTSISSRQVEQQVVWNVQRQHDVVARIRCIHF